MRTISRSTQFKRDFKRELKGRYGKTLDANLRAVLGLLVVDAPLPVSYRDHALGGPWKGYRDLHIHPDLVLIYEKPDETDLVLQRLGSHSECFS